MWFLNSSMRYFITFAYYGGRCPSNVVPITGLEADLTAGTPGFAWITPDLCHDGHDCSSATADDYLKTLVPKILASSDAAPEYPGSSSIRMTAARIVPGSAHSERRRIPAPRRCTASILRC